MTCDKTIIPACYSPMHDGLAQNHALKFEFLSKKQNGEHELILSG